MKRKIYIVDDNDLVRESYVMLIDVQPDLEVCGEAETAEEALDGLVGMDVDVALVDLRLGSGTDGLELLEALTDRFPDVRTIALTGHGDDVYRDRALAAGARRFLDKKDAARALLPTIRELAAE